MAVGASQLRAIRVLTRRRKKTQLFDHVADGREQLAGNSSNFADRQNSGPMRIYRSCHGWWRCRCYGDAICAHTKTRGLFAGIGLRHVAARSVGMMAVFRLGPQ